MTDIHVVVLPKKGRGWPKKAYIYINIGDKEPKYVFTRQSQTANWVGHKFYAMSLAQLIRWAQDKEKKIG